MKSSGAKPIWAVANESVLSAACAVASAADRICVTRTGEVGSIGVVAVHVDESGADAKAGLAWTFVFAGERKVDANAHEPLSERFWGLSMARRTNKEQSVRVTSTLCRTCHAAVLVVLQKGLSYSSEPAQTKNHALERRADRRRADRLSCR